MKRATRELSESERMLLWGFFCGALANQYVHAGGHKAIAHVRSILSEPEKLKFFSDGLKPTHGEQVLELMELVKDKPWPEELTP